MNVHTNNTPSPALPEGSINPADDVNRAKAIVLTVWMALSSPDFDTCKDDAGAVADTLYEAYQRLRKAEEVLGVYK